LNGLVAEWEGTIRASQAAPPVERGGKRRTAAEVLAALEGTLHEVDAQARGHQRAAAAAAAAAAEWEEKAELAIRGNRDAMARDALLRQAEHAAAAADEAVAATALADVHGMYVRAMNAVRETALTAAGEPPRPAI
jgi:phage shock protein A